MRIAVLRALHLGDLLLLIPALRALRAAFPRARIDFIGLPWARELLARFGYTDDFLEFPGWPGIPEVPVEADRLAAFLVRVRQRRYDLALQFHGNGAVSNGFLAALGARLTVGYYPADGHGLRPDLGQPYPEDLPEVLRCLNLLTLLGVRPRGAALEFPLHPADRAEAAARLGPADQPGRPLVVIHPGARPPARRWPAERFAALARRLRADGLTVVVVGGPGDRETLAAVRAHLDPAVPVIADLSLGGLAALLARATLFIGNDSGPAHLAVAVDTPSLRLFGPADPRRWAPLDQTRHRLLHRPVACSPCQHWTCPLDHRCLRQWTVPAVHQAARELLAATASPVARQPGLGAGRRSPATTPQSGAA